MKRDEHLYPLSWGPQHGLAFARQLKIFLENRSKGIEELIGQLEKFWQKELDGHFRAEEGILFPVVGLKISACRTLVERALEEHKTLRGYLEFLKAKPSEEAARQSLTWFADLLTNHIRFEERELFPLIESSLSPAEFDRIGDQLAGSQG